MVAACLLVVSLAAACRPTAEPEPRSVRGVLIDVAATSLTSVRSFDLRAEDGRRLTFRAAGDVGMTPGHLREHMVLGEPITVDR